MKKILATKKESLLHGERHLLQCCMCGENDRNKLIIEDISLGMGMSGDNYSFCKSCWQSKSLGNNLMELLGIDKEFGLKILDDCLELREIEIK